MRIVPILPSPTDEAKLKEQLNLVMEAAAACNFALDLQGFVRTWLMETARCVVSYDDDNKPTGIGFMVAGRRWFDEENSASVLFYHGPSAIEILKYLKDTAFMLGAMKFFYEGDALGGEQADLRMLRLRD